MAVATARRPRTCSIARRYSGLARIERADGLASTNSVSSRGRLAPSGAGVGQHAGLVDDQDGPGPEAAVGQPRDPVGADRRPG